MSKGYVRVADAERLTAECEARLAEIWDDLQARIAQRIAAGEDPRLVAGEEVHRAVAQVDAAQAAFRKALTAVSIAPEDPAGG